MFDQEESHGWRGCQRRSHRALLPLLLSLLLPWSSVPAMTTATSVYGRIKELGMTRATSTIADETRLLPKIDSGHKTKNYHYCGDNDDNIRDDEHDKGATDSYVVAETTVWTGMVETTVEYSIEPQEIYNNGSVDETLISMSWTCYLPLILLALVWIVGPLICLMLPESEENNVQNEIILKNSHCHCVAKYTHQ